MATDPDIDHFLNQFQMAKALYRLSEMPYAQRKIFEELGLLDNPEFHFQLEALYAKGLNQQREIENAKSKGQQWRQLHK